MKLIIHAGYPKCGSSSIQAVLHGHKTDLYQLGIGIVSSVDLTGSAENANVLTGPSSALEQLYAGSITAEDVFARLLATLAFFRARKIDTAILSAENLAGGAERRVAGLIDVLSGLKGECAIYPIFYIRRQDELIESNWKQWAGKVTSMSFSDYLIEEAARARFIFSKLAAFWRDLSKGSPVVNIAAPEFLHERDLWKDFCHNCQLPAAVAAFAQDRRFNISPPKHWLDFLLEARNVMFKDAHDNRVYDIVETLLKDANYGRYRAQGGLTDKLRHYIMGAYAEENRRLVDEFFNGSSLALDYFEVNAPRAEYSLDEIRDEAAPSNPERGYQEMSILTLFHIAEEIGTLKRELQRDSNLSRQS